MNKILLHHILPSNEPRQLQELHSSFNSRELWVLQTIEGNDLDPMATFIKRYMMDNLEGFVLLNVTTHAHVTLVKSVMYKPIPKNVPHACSCHHKPNKVFRYNPFGTFYSQTDPLTCIIKNTTCSYNLSKNLSFISNVYVISQ